VSHRLLWGLESGVADAWDSFLSINIVETFRRDPSCFLRVSYYKNLALLCGWRCSFILRSVEEGEGEDGDDRCTVDA